MNLPGGLELLIVLVIMLVLLIGLASIVWLLVRLERGRGSNR